MVDMNIVAQLENDGMEYKNAFKVANLMETEGISKKDAIKRVTEEITAAEKAEPKEYTAYDKIKDAGDADKLDKSALSEEDDPYAKKKGKK
jgi:uncharacterized protein YoaH (UPF0181 family)